MNSTPRTEKTFDCVAMKRKAQARIYEQIKDMTSEQEIAYFDRAARHGPLAEFWKKLEQQQPRVQP